jgi:DNA-binding transcriptional LysR family regulator
LWLSPQRRYPIAQEKQLSLADLETIPLIIRDDGSKHGTTETLLLKLRSLGHRPNIVMRCESPQAIKTAVSKKLGVGILYQDVLKQPTARGLFKQLREWCEAKRTKAKNKQTDPAVSLLYLLHAANQLLPCCLSPVYSSRRLLFETAKD